MAASDLMSVDGYEFEGGFPTPETIQRAYDDADLVRAVTAYRFFYPSASAVCVYDGNIDSGMVANRKFCVVRDAVGSRPRRASSQVLWPRPMVRDASPELC